VFGNVTKSKIETFMLKNFFSLLIISFLFNKYSFADFPKRYQLGPQDPATPIAEGMIYFHNYVMFYVIAIGLFVFWLLYCAYRTNSGKVSKFSHSNILEIIWTIIPAFILIFIAVPSFSLLYSLDELSQPQVTIKIIGHQWYWTYEYSDYIKTYDQYYSTLSYDCYMLSYDDLMYFSPWGGRLMETDLKMNVPIKTHVRLLVTSSDVIHSWAIPSFGIKVDAIPGRLSQASLFVKRSGIFYGQCSEICGVNHGFMPIMVRAMPYSEFYGFYSKYYKLISK